MMMRWSVCRRESMAVLAAALGGEGREAGEAKEGGQLMISSVSSE